MAKAIKKSPTWIILILFSLITLFPMFWMLISSFKIEQEIYLEDPTWFPEVFTLQNYKDLFTKFDFGLLTINTVVITLTVVLICLILGTMASYGFSRYPFPGSTIALGALLLTRMVTPSALVLPLYIIMEKWGLLNTLTSIIMGISVLNLPFVIWIMKPFFDDLPKEIEEAAQLDGLSPFRIFWKIALPLAKPALITVFLFTFIAGWVDVLFAMTFSTVPDAMPLTMGLLQMQTGYKVYWGPMMAGGIYVTVPTFVLSYVLQKYLIAGLRSGY